jgi:hypothetical protein
MRELASPAAVAHGVDFYPDPSLPLVKLERPRATRNPEVPVPAAGTPCKLAFALNDEPVPAARL